MQIIITGGLGFIGNSLFNKLKSNNVIYLIDKKKSKTDNYLNLDLSNENSLKKLNLRNIDTILHFAGQSSVAKSYENPTKDLKDNILGTINILNWAKKNKVKRFIFASSYNVYSEKKNGSLKETDSCKPKSFYGISKLACENYIQAFCYENKINWNILRLFNVYGPNQEYTSYHGLVNIFLKNAIRYNFINIKGSIKRFRDFIYIDDLVNIIKKLIKSKKNINKIYNIGSGKKTKLDKLIKILEKKINKKIKFKVLSGTKGDFFGCFANISKLKKELSYTPKYELEYGLNQILNNEKK